MPKALVYLRFLLRYIVASIGLGVFTALLLPAAGFFVALLVLLYGLIASSKDVHKFCEEQTLRGFREQLESTRRRFR